MSFVSGRSHDRFTPRVTVHDRPISWDEFLKLSPIRPAFVSHASQVAMENEAEMKRIETEPKPSQMRPKKRSVSKFSLPVPFHGCDEPYELDPQVKRMRLAVRRIRDRMETITTLYETIVKPNRSQRREYDAIMRRHRHEIDSVA